MTRRNAVGVFASVRGQFRDALLYTHTSVFFLRRIIAHFKVQTEKYETVERATSTAISCPVTPPAHAGCPAPASIDTQRMNETITDTGAQIQSRAPTEGSNAATIMEIVTISSILGVASNVEVRGSRSEAQGTKSAAFGCPARLSCWASLPLEIELAIGCSAISEI